MYSKCRELTACLCEIFTSLDVTFGGKKIVYWPKRLSGYLERKTSIVSEAYLNKLESKYSLSL